MIIDSHCHAWAVWPYDAHVPDPEQRGSAGQLLYEMDRHQVDRALVVCAQIDRNPANNAYVAEQVRRNADRLFMLADVDSMWSDTYHTPGAASRLETAAALYPLTGFTHYSAFEDDGRWLNSEEGLAFFGAANRLDLLASLHCHPHQQTAVRRVAAAFPEMPILLHHLGHPKVAEASAWREIIDSAGMPNIYLKVSGFYYATAQPQWDFPFLDVQPLLQQLLAAYGANRLCWGSDYPVARRFISYAQSLELLRTHCGFLSDSDLALVLGDSLGTLLNGRG